jgi:nucleotide-binding universal stress UspA family protein
MKDHILYAIDFSESSVRSLQWASKLANDMGAHLAVLFSYRLTQTGKLSELRAFKRKTEEEAKEKYLALCESLNIKENPAQSFITEIGFYSDNIENFVRKNPSTLVVLSETMANEIYDHTGQNLIQFLKQLNVPLLIVPGRQHPAPVPEPTPDHRAVA